MSTTVHDFVAIGVGPFNLGLAALSDPVEELDGVFLDAAPDFRWHPGMMLRDATLQVPFLADLVTMADPTSAYSFLSYLKQTGRLYPFYVRESFHPLRSEYDDYCRWVADQLDQVHFSQEVTSVEHDTDGPQPCYAVHTAAGRTWRGRRLVLGIGTSPRIPQCLQGLHDLQGPGGPVTHSSHYLDRKADLQQTGSITVVGSGQSAAEVYADLLAERAAHGYELTWVTRSPRLFAMDDTRMTLEMTSPEYTAYFQSLPAEQREELLGQQAALYKGISADTLAAIHEELYTQTARAEVPTTLLTATEVTAGSWDGSAYTLDLHHNEQQADLRLRTDSLVLATGYSPTVPDFLAPVRDRVRVDDQGRFVASEHYSVDHQDREIFVQNAEEHTHGFVAPDLGMGAFRNSILINHLAGREVYPVEKRVAFQEFGAPDRLRVDSHSGAPA